MSDVLTVHREAASLELTLNRPTARNALSRALIDELTSALRAADADETVRTVILTGAPPAFCAGLDLREVAGATPEQAEADSQNLLTLFETIDNLSKPMIAAVNGPAVAGGAGLASVCDFVLCAASATLGYPEIKRGLVAAIVMCYLRRLVGELRAKHLLLTGESVTAAQAVEFGLATELVADADLLPRTRHYATLLAALPAGPLAHTKALWNRIRPLDHAQAVQEARALNAAMRLTRDSQAGAERFLRVPPSDR